MFNLGLLEMILLGLIALVVIGPRQLPQLARIVVSLLNQWKTFVKEAKAPLEQIKQEIKKPLEEPSIKASQNLQNPISSNESTTTQSKKN